MHKFNWNPSPRELRVFAVLLVPFCGFVAYLLYRQMDAMAAPLALWAAAIVVAVVGVAAPKLIRPVYLVWMAACYPIGWLVSHAVLAGVYYGVLTPIALAMRAAGRDSLHRRFDREAASYWIARGEPPETRRYFRQF